MIVSSSNVISSSAQFLAGVVDSAAILNGTILDADINAAAAIAYSKLALTGAILNADLAGSIADTKLNQITTASKVSGAALTLLANIPAGAGVIPAANLPVSTDLEVMALGIESYATSGTSLVTDSFSGKRRYADGVQTHAAFEVKVPKGATTISAIKIFFSSDTNTGNVAIIARTEKWPIAGGAVVTDSDAVEETFAVPGTAGQMGTYSIAAARWSSITSVAANDVVTLNLFGNRNSANDTNAGNFDVLGILITFA